MCSNGIISQVANRPRKSLFTTWVVWNEKITSVGGRAKRYLNLVGLYDFRNIYPTSCQTVWNNVGLACAYEWSWHARLRSTIGALDAITRKILSHSFSAAMREEHKSMLMVTSNIEEAIRYSDQIYIWQADPGETNIPWQQISRRNCVIQRLWLRRNRFA